MHRLRCESRFFLQFTCYGFFDGLLGINKAPREVKGSLGWITSTPYEEKAIFVIQHKARYRRSDIVEVGQVTAWAMDSTPMDMLQPCTPTAGAEAKVS